jgi:hypothetical protein
VGETGGTTRVAVTVGATVGVGGNVGGEGEGGTGVEVAENGRRPHAVRKMVKMKSEAVARRMDVGKVNK